MKIILTLALAVFLLVSCDELCIVGNYDYVKKTYDLNEFHSISHPFSGEVHLKAGTPKVEIEAESNIIDRFIFLIKDKKIDVEEKNNECLSPHQMKFTYYSTSFQGIENNGSADWSSDSLVFDPVIISNGSGDIKLKGGSNNQNILLNGSGDVDLKDMKTQNAIVQINGSGDCFLMVNGDLECVLNGSGDITVFSIEGQIKATINGSGNLYYSGNPKNIFLTRNGSGNVFKI